MSVKAKKKKAARKSFDYSAGKAAFKFRETLVKRSDGSIHGIYPWWHGWALYECFMAGVEWQKKREAASRGA